MTKAILEQGSQLWHQNIFGVALSKAWSSEISYTFSQELPSDYTGQPLFGYLPKILLMAMYPISIKLPTLE
jgi:hypothetical protein